MPRSTRARRRLAAFESDSRRVARHALKVNLVFTLLDKQRMSLAEMPAYVDRVGLYRDFNAPVLPNRRRRRSRSS